MTINIIQGIQLPAFDVELLNSGKLIIVPFQRYSREGEVFWLYPSQELPFNLELDQYYQPEYLTNARKSRTRYAKYPIEIKTWARCEHHWHINPEQKHFLPQITQSTIWNLSALEHIFEQYQLLRLLVLRVYRLTNPCIVKVRTASGRIYWPNSEDLITTGSESDKPIVSETSFNKRKEILLSGKVYPSTGIEALLFQCEQISYKSSEAEQFAYDIQQFLGWITKKTKKSINPDLDWIKKISAVGNSSNGNDFEKLVRKGLMKLGFTGSGVNPEGTGGPGGMDFYCEHPYPMVGECKATKSEKVSDGTPAQLLKIGINHLGQVQYDRSIKLIVAAGELNSYALRTATQNKMNVIRPETLEKLVELKHNYPGSLDLFELKKYLEKEPFAEDADQKVNSYIDNIYQCIKLRSQIAKAVREISEQKEENSTATQDSFTVTEIRAHYNATNNPKQTDEKVYELLLELSSPLTGYLGRQKGSDWKSDKFYYLRDLPTP
jgi:Domain of unknown function (DUF1802)